MIVVTHEQTALILLYIQALDKLLNNDWRAKEKETTCKRNPARKFSQRETRGKASESSFSPQPQRTLVN